MTGNKQKYYWILGITLGGLIAGEVGLRLILGLGNPPLIQADPQMGYRFQPNQQTRRFGHQIIYNQYSQRSQPITAEKPPQTLRILMTGDSVLNGGTVLDQEDTISGQLQHQLDQAQIPAEVLNASAGSWGIGNQLGYLKVFGFLESDILIVQIGTHDLTQSTSTGDRVGRDPNYPTHKPLLALQELLTRYLLPQIQLRFGIGSTFSEIPASPLSPDEQFQANLADLTTLLDMTRQQKIPVYVLYTPNWIDVLPQPHTPPYKQAFVEFLATQQVPLIDIQADWSQLPTDQVMTYFRDSVHLTAAGNQRIGQLLWQTLCAAEDFCQNSSSDSPDPSVNSPTL